MICAAIAQKHTAQDLPNPCESAFVEAILSGAERDAPPSPVRSLPLDLECYLAIRETAHLPRKGRGAGRSRNGRRGSGASRTLP